MSTLAGLQEQSDDILGVLAAYSRHIIWAELFCHVATTIIVVSGQILHLSFSNYCVRLGLSWFKSGIDSLLSQDQMQRFRQLRTLNFQAVFQGFLMQQHDHQKTWRTGTMVFKLESYFPPSYLFK